MDAIFEETYKFVTAKDPGRMSLCQTGSDLELYTVKETNRYFNCGCKSPSTVPFENM